MKNSGMLTILLMAGKLVAAQQTPNSQKHQWADFAATVGKAQGAAAVSYVYAWRLGKRKRLEAGVGARFTSMLGERVEFITAPARLARTNATPFLVVFAGQQINNWDTLVVQRPFVNSLNLTANFSYHFSSRWSALFNIDLVGFSFGRKSSAILNSNGTTSGEPAATPAAFNALLTGDLDYGNLNSEFSIKYQLNQRWAVRGIYQFLFTEYRTNQVKQTAPDGTLVDRFRNKANNLGAGFSYTF